MSPVDDFQFFIGEEVLVGEVLAEVIGCAFFRDMPDAYQLAWTDRVPVQQWFPAHQISKTTKH